MYVKMRALPCVLLMALVAIETTFGHGGRSGNSLSVIRGWRSRGRNSNRRPCRDRGDVRPEKVPDTGASPVSQVRTVVSTCTEDVGACPTGSCRYDPRRPEKKCDPDGYLYPVTTTKKVDCGEFGIHEVQVVTSCTCRKDNGIEVTGQVDSLDQIPIPYVYIKTNTGFNSFSRSMGIFKFKIDSDIRRLVLRTYKYGFLPAVKVIDIPIGFRGPININMVMLEQAEPEIINASEDNELSISSNPSDPDEPPRATIKIPQNSFITRRGNRVYTGQVEVSVNFIDPSDSDVEAEVPGQFITTGGLPLITDGMVAISYRAVTGEPLQRVVEVTMEVRYGMQLWKLSDEGYWVETGSPVTRRKKRQQSLTEQFVLSLDNGGWINIDKIPNAPICYFKGRVFWETSNTEISSSETATYKPSVVGYTQQNQRLRLYHAAISTPATTCYEVRCPDISNPNDLLVGVIGMKSFESVPVGGANVPVISTLKPRLKTGFSAAIQTDLSSVEYEVLPSPEEVFVNFISNSSGPFYPNLTDCESTSTSETSIHFLKPDLPSYVSGPADTDICTARIGFFDNYNFYNVLNDLPSLPSVTITSTWTVNDTDYFYTHTTVMQYSTVSGNDTFIYICAKYRCSTSDANTTVYMDIDIPIITVNNTRQDAYNTTAFQCWGNCTTANCQGQGDLQQVGIEGSFIAPVNVSSNGPDFYTVVSNDCSTRTRNETFAATYNCYSRLSNGDSSGNQVQ